MAQAMSGFLGTLVTGILASAVIAIFVRAKPAPR
jgi:fructose-specific phosphotransferase system IIC component